MKRTEGLAKPSQDRGSGREHLTRSIRRFMRMENELSTPLVVYETQEQVPDSSPPLRLDAPS